MIISEYHLYRIKFIKPSQRKLFPPELAPSEIFLEALLEKPTIELRRDNVWNIWNIHLEDDKLTGVFAIGRTTKTAVEKFDTMTKDFLVKIDEASPYTIVAFDRSIGLLGIAKKTKVAADTNAIAIRIQRLFDSTQTVKDQAVEVKVDLIPDTKSFIDKIKNAYAIKQFSAHFTGPNPTDADELFQKPLSVYCQKLAGENGVVEVVGNSLDSEVIEAVTKSTAATGNTASAKVQMKSGTKPIKIFLKGDVKKVVFNFTDNIKRIIQEIRDAYYEVRN